MSDDEIFQDLGYFLARSVVRVSGTRTTTVDALASGAPAVETEATVELVEQADPHARFVLDVDNSTFKDIDGTIGFTPDRRLASLSVTSTGTATKVVGGVVRFATGLVAAATTGVRLATGAGAGDGFDATPTPPADPVATAYRSECPAAATNLAELRTAVASVRAAIVSAAQASDSDPAAAAKLQDLLKAAKALAPLLADAEAHLRAWRATKVASTVETLSFEIPLVELASSQEVTDRIDSLDADVLGEKAWAAYQQLGAFATITNITTPSQSGPEPGRSHPGMFFRLPRTVWIEVYERTADGPPRRREGRRALVYDALSESGYLSFETGVWGSKALAAELDAGSAPAKITVGATSGAAAVADAIGGIGEQVTKGLTDVTGALAQFDTLRDHRIDRQISRLEKEQKLLEREAALDRDGTSVEVIREVERLKREKELLTLRKDVGDLVHPPAPAPADDGDGAPARRIVISLEP